MTMGMPRSVKGNVANTDSGIERRCQRFNWCVEPLEALNEQTSEIQFNSEDTQMERTCLSLSQQQVEDGLAVRV